MSEFTIERYKVDVSTKAASVTAEAYLRSDMRAIITLAHGAGTNLDHPFLKKLAAGLAQHRFGVVRYNFIYTEQMKKMPDRFPAASEVIQSVVADCISRYKNVPLYLSGKSFGGRMSSMTMGANPELPVNGIIFFGFPLHPADTPSVERAEHLANVKVPMLFLQGTKDTLAYTDLIVDVTNKLPNAKLVLLEGLDHSFNRGKQTGIDQLISQTIQWLEPSLSSSV